MLEYCVNTNKTPCHETGEMFHVVHKMDFVDGRLRHCLPNDDNRHSLDECPDTASAVEKAENEGFSPARECDQCRKQG